MHVRIVYRRDRFLRGGDHIPFLERRLPGGRFTEVNENYRHQHQDVRVEDGVQYGDLPEFVDFAYIARVARVNAAALAALANGPAAPRDVAASPAKLSNDTELSWNANAEPDLAGYEIVWRDTTEPQWTHAIAVGNTTSYTVEGHHEGQLPLRRARRRSPRPSERRQLPAATAVEGAGQR